MQAIIDIVFGSFLLGGALFGGRVLIGTRSSGALAAVGGVLIAVGLVRIFKSKQGG